MSYEQNKKMKTMIRLLTCAVVAAMSTEVSKAAINIPSDGSDGALVITNDTVIDLSQAVTGNWDDNNSANEGNGIYDSNKWAVVFKYSSVVVQGGATVTFKNHASRAPVVWLVSGDVSINGTVSLNGQDAMIAPALAEPGPGGFRGGAGYYAANASCAAGFGPGGGDIAGQIIWGQYYGAGGSYGSVGKYGSPTYGNPSLIPLVGGSGASGGSDSNHSGGGGGAGAILVACGGTLSVTGAIQANGAAGVQTYGGFGGSGPAWSGGGSGGGIRLVAESLVGGGLLQALGGGGNDFGGLGRIRIERGTNTSTLTIVPDPSVVNLTSGANPQIWLPTNGPTIKVLSIGGNVSPADPRAEFGAIGADIVLPQVTNTTVVVETTNVEQASVVTVRATPRSNGNYSEATATVTAVISEDPLVLRWTANVPVQNGYAAIQAKVVRP